MHTLDPDPDLRDSSEYERLRDSEQRGYSDHADHTPAGCFAWAALIRWVAAATGRGEPVPGFVVTAFRGYYNHHWPKNLPPKVLERKAAHLVPYGGAPDWECGNPSGCGDYNIGGDRPLASRKGWVRSTHHRYPGPRAQVASGADGKLTVYGVLGLRAVRWRESAPGSGTLDVPDDLGGGPLAPVLGSATAADGRHLLFGLRFAELSGHGSDNEREIVLLEQGSPGGPFRAWRGLGNPAVHGDHGRRVGTPVAVAAPDGRVHLFVRNAEKGLSTRVRDAGTGRWGGWRDLGGGEVQDGLTAVVDTAGRVHVYAAGHHAVHHWTHDAPASDVTARTQLTEAPVPAHAPGALPAPDGSVELYYRPAARERLAAVRTGPAPAPRFGGYGPVTAAASPGGPVLLGRSAEGRIQLRTAGGIAVRSRGPCALDGVALHLGAGAGGPPSWGSGPTPRPGCGVRSSGRVRPNCRSITPCYAQTLVPRPRRAPAPCCPPSPTDTPTPACRAKRGIMRISRLVPAAAAAAACVLALFAPSASAAPEAPLQDAPPPTTQIIGGGQASNAPGPPASSRTAERPVRRRSSRRPGSSPPSTASPAAVCRSASAASTSTAAVWSPTAPRPTRTARTWRWCAWTAPCRRPTPASARPARSASDRASRSGAGAPPRSAAPRPTASPAT